LIQLIKVMRLTHVHFTPQLLNEALAPLMLVG
jgi:hypothetical protein